MGLKAEGFWPCTVLGATAGEENDDRGPTGVLVVRINTRIDDGPDKGRLCTYEDKVNEKSSLYIRRSLTAVGWRGDSLTSVADDVAAWIAKTGGKSTVEIKHLEIKNGKNAGKYWDKVQSIGRGPKPLAAPSTTSLSDADAAMRRAAEVDGGSAPADDVPHSSSMDPDSIPF